MVLIVLVDLYRMPNKNVDRADPINILINK